MFWNHFFAFDLFQPFGKRSGSKADNRVLYPKILNSMARVVKPVTGRAVLLTQDKNSMFKVNQINSMFEVNP
jgi:23S rRNA G2445 N2-methylase RlmL